MHHWHLQVDRATFSDVFHLLLQRLDLTVVSVDHLFTIINLLLVLVKVSLVVVKFVLDCHHEVSIGVPAFNVGFLELLQFEPFLVLVVHLVSNLLHLGVELLNLALRLARHLSEVVDWVDVPLVVVVDVDTTDQHCHLWHSEGHRGHS